MPLQWSLQHEDVMMAMVYMTKWLLYQPSQQAWLHLIWLPFFRSEQKQLFKQLNVFCYPCDYHCFNLRRVVEAGVMISSALTSNPAQRCHQWHMTGSSIHLPWKWTVFPHSNSHLSKDTAITEKVQKLRVIKDKMERLSRDRCVKPGATELRL